MHPPSYIFRSLVPCLAPLLLIWALASSCGDENSETHIKDFTFYITESGFPEELNQSIEKVFERLNEKTGLNRFRLAQDIRSANSFFNLARVGKYFGEDSIGAAAPIYKIKRDTDPTAFGSSFNKVTVLHGMDIDLDRDWIINNIVQKPFSLKSPFQINQLNRRKRSNYSSQYKNFITEESFSFEIFEVLVLHEIGHGLNFSHANSPEDIMFNSISKGKNLRAFYQRVRESLKANHY